METLVPKTKGEITSWVVAVNELIRHYEFLISVAIRKPETISDVCYRKPACPFCLAAGPDCMCLWQVFSDGDGCFGHSSINIFDRIRDLRGEWMSVAMVLDKKIAAGTPPDYALLEVIEDR